MKTKILSIIIAISTALALTACGEDEKSSAPANSASDKTSSQSTSSIESTPISSSEPSDSSDDNDAERSDRHYYKSVTFYGALEWLTYDYKGSSGYSEYPGAVSLTYDTATGKIQNIRVVDYFDTAVYDEDKQQERLRNKIEHSGKKFSNLPYKTQNLSDSRSNEITAIIWETNDLELINFNQYIYTYFIAQDIYDGYEKQDIDGLIKSIFYDLIDHVRIRPLPYFDDNAFCYKAAALFAISFTDTLWSIKDPDKWSDRLHFDASASDELIYNFNSAEYGSTSYNTGGGYTGTYNCLDFLDKE